jgi:hypothetical protein
VAATFARDTSAPRASAIPSSGRAGGGVALRYRISDDSGSASAELRVRRGSRVLDTIRRPAEAAHGRLAVAHWYAPARARRGGLVFCVRATDAAGNRSGSACAPVRLR